MTPAKHFSSSNKIEVVVKQDPIRVLRNDDESIASGRTIFIASGFDTPKQSLKLRTNFDTARESQLSSRVSAQNVRNSLQSNLGQKQSMFRQYAAKQPGPPQPLYGDKYS